jgi:predicted hotdog family 3-hydroxylacyl-ACP dehydratase
VPDRVPETASSPDAPLDRLPHTGAARLPQRVIRLEPGVRVVVERDLRPGDPVLNEGGMLPSALLIELMAQAGGLLMEDRPGGMGGLLAGLRRLHVHAGARAGETVVVSATLVRRLGDIVMVACEAALRDGRVLAHGQILIRRLAADTP